MGRLCNFLILLLVLNLGSAFTLACAFACQAERASLAAAPVSHCHQAKFPPGDGIRPLPVHCPVMDALPNAGDRSLQPVIRTPVARLAFLPFETLLLFPAGDDGVSRRVFARAPSPRPPPPFSKSLVLRL